MLKRLITCLGVTLLMSAAASADEPPHWLKEAASTKLPAYGKEVSAVVLHDESRKTVGDDGKIVTTTWWAVKILSREGRGHARASEGYITGSGKIKEMRAWLIPPTGEVKSYGKKETVDLAIVDNDVYNEVRKRDLRR